MNNFKNVATFGKQKIKVFDNDAKIIRNYLKFLKDNKVNSNKFILNYYLQVLEYSPDMYARNLTKKLLKSTGKKITMNQVRSSYETALIQSDAYKQMSNQEKDEAHKRLLHSTYTAQSIYNKVEGCSDTRSETKPCKCCGK